MVYGNMGSEMILMVGLELFRMNLRVHSNVKFVIKACQKS